MDAEVGGGSNKRSRPSYAHKRGSAATAAISARVESLVEQFQSVR